MSQRRSSGSQRRYLAGISDFSASTRSRRRETAVRFPHQRRSVWRWRSPASCGSRIAGRAVGPLVCHGSATPTAADVRQGEEGQGRRRVSRRNRGGRVGLIVRIIAGNAPLKCLQTGEGPRSPLTSEMPRAIANAGRFVGGGRQLVAPSTDTVESLLSRSVSASGGWASS